MFDVEKIIGNKKDKNKTKFTDMSLSGAFGKNPFSDMVGKLTDKPLRNFGVNNPIKMDCKSRNKEDNHVYKVVLDGAYVSGVGISGPLEYAQRIAITKYGQNKDSQIWLEDETGRTYPVR